MSAITNLGQPQPTPPLHTPITFKSAMHKFEAISQDILFGPGMVARFAETFYKIVNAVDGHFYAKRIAYAERIAEEMNASRDSLLLHPLSKSQSARFYSSENDESSRAESLSPTNSDSEIDPFPASSFTPEANALIHLLKQSGYLSE